jgi:hypothetical protein
MIQKHPCMAVGWTFAYSFNFGQCPLEWERGGKKSLTFMFVDTSLIRGLFYLLFFSCRSLSPSDDFVARITFLPTLSCLSLLFSGLLASLSRDAFTWDSGYVASFDLRLTRSNDGQFFLHAKSLTCAYWQFPEVFTDTRLTKLRPYFSSLSLRVPSFTMSGNVGKDAASSNLNCSRSVSFDQASAGWAHQCQAGIHADEPSWR